MQFSFWAAKVERSLSHLVPLKRSLSLLFKCVVTETARGAAGASEPSPVGDLTSHFQREAVFSVQDTAKVGCRPGAEKTQLVCFVLFCLSYPPVALPNPVVWLLEGVSCRRRCVRFPWQWTAGMLSQVAGAGSPARLLAASVSRRQPSPLSAPL